MLFSIGTRFNDRITGKLHEFAPHAQIIHIDIDTASISRNIQVDIPIVADAKEALSLIHILPHIPPTMITLAITFVPKALAMASAVTSPVPC